jgi:hypothetical protein
VTASRDVALEWGGGTPLDLELPHATVFDLRGPAGCRGSEASRIVRSALAGPHGVPPLSSHVVPGDRVTIAVAGGLTEERSVVAAVIESLAGGGVAEQDIAVLRSHEFATADDSRTGYLAADAEANPIYLARDIIDADCVVTIAEWNWDASLAGRGIDGEIFPAFSRKSCRESLVRRLLDGPHAELTAWRDSLGEVVDKLGLLASLRIIPGTNATVAGAVFGSPETSHHAASDAAADWRPTVAAAVDCSIASLHEPAGAPPDFEGLVRGVAAAARITAADGTICVASRLCTHPGPVFARWRQGLPLSPLVREAVESDDPALIADAFLARRFHRALGGRRLVLLSGLDEETVEDLAFGFADSPETIQRLAKRARNVAVLHEADRMLPAITP